MELNESSKSKNSTQNTAEGHMATAEEIEAANLIIKEIKKKRKKRINQLSKTNKTS